LGRHPELLQRAWQCSSGNLDAIQRELRDIAGVTVLIYAQTCATEKRRRRKRGKLVDPDRIVVINDLVCEGCGDCSVESNCLSVVPKETPFGRKRQIDQNTCNKDFSCVNGFCPSFVTVEGIKKKQASDPSPSVFPDERLEMLDEPSLPELERGYDLLVTGVGGTGVVTVGALITMAAHLEGKGASVLDFMGFAQKFGPVLSYIRIAREPALLNQVRIDREQADALIGCDLVVSSSPKASRTYRAGHTRAVINTTEMSTADFVRHRDASLKASERLAAIERVVGTRNISAVAANRIAERLRGNTIYSNVLLLGYAWQQGLVPVSLKALLRAIELNAVETDRNRQAFGWGRIAAADPGFLSERMGAASGIDTAPETLDQVIVRRAGFLRDYQDDRLAEKYTSLTSRIRDAERQIDPDSSALTEAVARAYFKTLAYKDEYEVARLHTQTGFLTDLKEQYGKQAKISFHLAPPLLGGKLDARGRPGKRQFGPWIIPLFRVLAKLRRLRGTPLDVFGLTAERRMERALIGEFEATLGRIMEGLSAENVGDAVAIVGRFLDIRGYGPVKDLAVAEVRKDISRRLASFGTVKDIAA
jgi:indolepyruvate ferredoxin oxidoreductase